MAFILRKRERYELESYNEYDSVVAQLNDRTRVIACKDNEQWIVQRRSGSRWNGVSFCRSKAALLRCCGALGEQFDANAIAVLWALPDWIRDPQTWRHNTAETTTGSGSGVKALSSIPAVYPFSTRKAVWVPLTDRHGMRMTRHWFERDERNVVRCTRCWLGFGQSQSLFAKLKQHTKMHQEA